MTHTTPAAGQGLLPETEDALHRALDAEQVVERYLLGRLDEEAAERFEQHYFDCPACLERLEVHEALLDGLRLAAVEDTVRVTTAARWVLWLRALGPRARALAATAAIVLLVPTVWLGWRALGLAGDVETLRRQVDTLQSPAADPWRIALAPERDAGTDPSRRQLRLPSEDRLLVLTLEVGLVPGEVYTLTLEGPEASWSRPTTADAAGQLVVALPTSALEPGDLDLLVTTPSEAAVAQIPLQVLPAQASPSN